LPWPTRNTTLPLGSKASEKYPYPPPLPRRILPPATPGMIDRCVFYGTFIKPALTFERHVKVKGIPIQDCLTVSDALAAARSSKSTFSRIDLPPYPTRRPDTAAFENSISRPKRAVLVCYGIHCPDTLSNSWQRLARIFKST
jgi:hypothetical protein